MEVFLRGIVELGVSELSFNRVTFSGENEALFSTLLKDEYFRSRIDYLRFYECPGVKENKDISVEDPNIVEQRRKIEEGKLSYIIVGYSRKKWQQV